MGDKKVQMPNGAVVSFPDSMPDDQISAIMKQQATRPDMLTANPAGQGVYKMSGPDGKVVGIPYGNVPLAQGNGYGMWTTDEASRYKKDAAADPAQQGQQKTLWQKLNTPVNVGNLRDYIDKAEYFSEGPHTQAEAQWSADHPVASAVNTFSNSVAGDAATMFLTPLGLGMAATGGVGEGADAALQDVRAVAPTLKSLAPFVQKVAPALTAARTASRLTTGAAGIGFGAQGGADLIRNRTRQPNETEADYQRRILGDASMMVGGAMTMLHAAPTVSNMTAAAKQRGMAMLTGDVNKIIPGDTVTQRQRYQIAKGQGVQLDLAQATDGTVPMTAKRAVEGTLPGSGDFDALRTANQKALNDYAQGVLSSVAPESMSPEDFGNAAQQTFLQHQQGLADEAEGIFQNLSSEAGGSQPDLSGTRAEARQIIRDNGGYYDKHPEMLTGTTGKAWQIVNDLARDPNDAARVVDTGMVDAAGRPITRTIEPEPDTWNDAHKLRTDLVAQYRNSPELANTQAGGWLKQLAGSVEDAMTGAGSNLTGQQLQNFRRANDIDARMQTYDDPQSTLAQVIRAPNALTAAEILNRAKPSTLRFMQQYTPEIVPQLQRQAMERMLSPAGNGVEWGTLPERLSRAAQQKLNGILSPEQFTQLQNLARTSRIVNADSNISGIGKIMSAMTDGKVLSVGGSEAATSVALGHPKAAIAAVPPYAAALGTKVISKLLTSPAVVDRIMGVPSKWVNAGEANLIDHVTSQTSGSLTGADIRALRQTPQGARLLGQASSLKPGSKAMVALAAQIAAQKSQNDH